MTAGHRIGLERGLETFAKTTTVESMAGGIVAQQILTADSGPHADAADTNSVLNNVSVVAGHTYGIHFRSQVSISAVASTWVIELKLNTVVLDRLWAGNNEGAVALTEWCDSWTFWDAPTTQATDDFLISVDETTATAATLTLNGGAALRRILTIIDLGVI